MTWLLQHPALVLLGYLLLIVGLAICWHHLILGAKENSRREAMRDIERRAKERGML